MFKRAALSALLGLQATLLLGQTDLSADIPKIIPPTPNAAAIEKFGDVPVDYSTGVPSISYPMWSWQRGKLSLNLGLSYHAGGHKVQDMAPVTGLGWALSAGGRVSRTVNGLPDDEPVKGFIYTPVLPVVLWTNYDPEEYYYTSNFPNARALLDKLIGYNDKNDTALYPVISAIAKGDLDAEQDIFSYSANSISGRFIINKDQEIVPLEHTNCKIEPFFTSYSNGHPTGRISSFKITDDNGLVYEFSYLEEASCTASPASFGSSGVSYSGSWLLTSIRDPSASDTITFSYSNRFCTYESSFGESLSYHLDIADPPADHGLQVFGIESDQFNFQTVETEEAYLNSITLPDGSAVELTYAFERDDLVNSRGLTKVLVKNMADETIKRFDLSYSYFLSGETAYHPEWATSENDFNKRLRLDRITEVSNDGTLQKPTDFTYNAIALNPRDSKNHDYWGYNVNPARNNLNYVPKVPTEGPERPFGLFLEGGDQRPDDMYSKAGVLEKITYPTGGFTSFEYENNTAYSELQYFQNELSNNALSWSQAQFNTNKSLSMSDRSDTAIVLHLQITEDNARPPYDPNNIQGCLESAQDDQPVSFVITSTDSSFSTSVDDTYGAFLGGVDKVLNLPLNKTYRAKFVYDDNVTCSYIYPFTASVQATYYEIPQDKLAGGLRIKKVTSDDGSGKTLTREYSYNLSNGHVSATLNFVPNFGCSRSTLYYYIPPSNGSGELSYALRYVNRTSSPVTTVAAANGAPLIYTRVIEKIADSSSIERTFDPITSYGGRTIFPFIAPQELPVLSGLLLNLTERNAQGDTTRTEVYTYDKQINSLVNSDENRNVKTGVISRGQGFSETQNITAEHFWRARSEVRQTAKTTTLYENSLTSSQTEATAYDATYKYPNKITRINSKGDTIQTYVNYPFDESGTAFLNMVTANILSPKTRIKITKGSATGTALQTTKTHYAVWNSTGFFPDTIQNNIRDNAFEVAATFQAYDAHGNLQQYTAKDGITTSIIYGYHNQYPVAKIVGKSYSDAVSQSGVTLTNLDEPSSDVAMRSDLAYLRTLTNCQVYTYTYKPLVGITSETDPNGKTAFYEYDNYNRLYLIRDRDGNVLKKFCYKYDGQPVDCDGLVYENRAMSDTFTKTCSGFNLSVIYAVPPGKYTASTQIVADSLAQADIDANGQGYVNAQTCPAPVACNENNCTGADKKCINGVCETGTKVCTSVSGSHGNFTTTYHYEWSDNSSSQDYEEPGIGCLSF